MTNKTHSGLVSPQDAENYRRDGAICVRKALDPNWVERIRVASARVIEEKMAQGEAAGGFRPTRPQFHNVLFMYKTDPDFRALGLDSPLPRIAADITGSERIILFGDHLLVKEPGNIETTPWHHDLPYWPIRGEQMCSIWLALDTVTRESGALEYIAGSHLWGRMFHPLEFSAEAVHIPGVNLEQIPDIDAQREQHTILSWDMEPGDILVHHPLVVHGAGRNASLERSRRALSLRYTGDDVRFFGSTLMGGNEGPFKVDLAPGDTLDHNNAYPVANL